MPCFCPDLQCPGVGLTLLGHNVPLSFEPFCSKAPKLTPFCEVVAAAWFDTSTLIPSLLVGAFGMGLGRVFLLSYVCSGSSLSHAIVCRWATDVGGHTPSPLQCMKTSTSAFSLATFSPPPMCCLPFAFYRIRFQHDL